jgi:hypothetical protein
MIREADLLGLDALPARQKKVADVEAAKGMIELMRQAESRAMAEVVSGPPILEATAEPVNALPAPEGDDGGAAMADVAERP